MKNTTIGVEVDQTKEIKGIESLKSAHLLTNK